MTRKLGQMGLLVALVSVVVCGYLLSRTWAPPFAGEAGSRVANAIKRMPIDTKAEKRIDKLKPLLSTLRDPSPDQPAPLDLALLGYRKIVPPAPAPVVVAKPPPPKPHAYVVSMTYVSANRRFAVIDGRFYREGARLPGGEVVQEISPNAVRIGHQGTTRELEIEKSPDALSKQGGSIKIDSTDVGGNAQSPARALIAGRSTS